MHFDEFLKANRCNHDVLLTIDQNRQELQGEHQIEINEQFHEEGV